MSLRTTLNSGNLNQLGDCCADIKMGELLTLAIASLTPTEAAVVPVAHVATLAATPSALFQVNVTAGGSTGIKKLLKGPITGEDAISPAPGECVWNGGVSVKFNAVDNATAVSFTYATATDKLSILEKNLGQTTNV